VVLVGAAIGAVASLFAAGWVLLMAGGASWLRP
jgi:hypothetical protein